MNPDDWNNARRAKASPQAPDVDRLPPHSVEAEQGVLGCILLSPEECLNTCVIKLKAGALAFYDLRHQQIYATVMRMHDARHGIDLITLQQTLRDAGELEKNGGVAYLSSLPDLVPSAANLDHYLAIVLEKFKLRRLVGLCTEIIVRIYGDHPAGADLLLDQIEADVSSVTETQCSAGERPMKDMMKVALLRLEEHYNRGALQLDGLPTGPAGNYLDKMLGGIAPEDYGVIAGRPGSGKTSFAMNIAEYLALDYEWFEPTGEFHPVVEGDSTPRPVLRQRRGVPVAIFSIEMTADSLGWRMLFGRAGVDMAQYKQGYKHADDDKKLLLAAEKLAACGIWVDDASEQTIGQIAAKARRMARQHGIKLFILDYIQLVEQDGGNGTDRVREITKISRKIMALKKQLKVPWIVLAQMNRNIETSERERKPVLSDLKDCGALEQDSDWVLFLNKTPREHRKPTDDKESDQDIIDRVCNGWDWSRVPYRVDAIIPKHRDGPTGEAKLLFQKNLCRILDWHMWKVQHGAEELKAGERPRVMKPQPQDEML